MPANAASWRDGRLPPALMLTVRYDRLGAAARRPRARPRLRLRPPRVRGRPARGAVVAFDYADAELRRCATPSARWSTPARSTPGGCAGTVQGDATRLPFADGDVRPGHRVRGPRAHPRRRRRAAPSCAGCCDRAARSPSPSRPGCPSGSAGRCRTSTTRRSWPAATSASTASRAARKLAGAGLRRPALPPRPRPALAVLVAALRRRARPTTTTALVRRYRQLPRVGHRRAPPRHPLGRPPAEPGARQEPRRLPKADGRPMPVPDLPACCHPTRGRGARHRRPIAGPAAAERDDPVVPGGHCDPWNHVETAMALDVAGLHAEAAAAYELAAPTSSAPTARGTTTTSPIGVEDAKLDTNVCAYVATGVWHHWLCTGDRGLRRASCGRSWSGRSTGCSTCRRRGARSSGPARSTAAVGVRAADRFVVDRPLARCAVRLAELVGERPSRLGAVATSTSAEVIRTRPRPSPHKHRWAMDWYYPVLTGVLHRRRRAGCASRPGGRPSSCRPGRALRSDEPWVTAAETAECAIAHRPPATSATAVDLLRWTGGHREPDGAYWPASCTPQQPFPDGERTAYTAAAVILAADALSGPRHRAAACS